MKQLFLILLLALLSLPSMAQRGPFGLGVIFGEPTGITGKYWMTESSAWDAGAGWSFDRNFVHLYTDYLLHFTEIDLTEGDLPVYIGIGGRVILESGNTILGARIPIGAEYIFEGEVIGIFLELVPILDLTPSTEFALNGGIGIRYYF